MVYPLNRLVSRLKKEEEALPGLTVPEINMQFTDERYNNIVVFKLIIHTYTVYFES